MCTVSLFVFREFERNIDARPPVHQCTHHEQAHDRCALSNFLQRVSACIAHNLSALFVAVLETVPAGGPADRGHSEEEDERPQNIARNCEGGADSRQHDARGTPVNRVAHARERAHQTNLHVGDSGIVNAFFTSCFFTFHCGSHTDNGGCHPRLGVEEFQVTGERLRLVFFLGVETLNCGNHGDREPNGLHAFEVK